MDNISATYDHDNIKTLRGIPRTKVTTFENQCSRLLTNVMRVVLVLCSLLSLYLFHVSHSFLNIITPPKNSIVIRLEG